VKGVEDKVLLFSRLSIVPIGSLLAWGVSHGSSIIALTSVVLGLLSPPNWRFSLRSSLSLADEVFRLRLLVRMLDMIAVRSCGPGGGEVFSPFCVSAFCIPFTVGL